MALIEFDKNNIKHVECLKKLNSDSEITKRFNGFLSNLLRNDEKLLNRGYLVEYDDNLVGYIDISSYNELDEAVYLREAIFEEYRGKGYGKRLLKDITDIIFNTYPSIKKIRLKIERDNTSSLGTAESNNYMWDSQDYYSIENPNYISDTKKR